MVCQKSYNFALVLFIISLALIFVLAPSFENLFETAPKEQQGIRQISPHPPKTETTEVQEHAEEKTSATQKKDYETFYERNAVQLNKAHNFGLFETKLLKYGYYTYIENGKEYTAFRADIWVKNAGRAAETFHGEDGYLRVVPNTYYVIGGTFYGYNVTPNETRSGYLLYNATKGLQGNATLIIGTAASYNTIFNTIGQFPFTYEIKLQ